MTFTAAMNRAITGVGQRTNPPEVMVAEAEINQTAGKDRQHVRVAEMVLDANLPEGYAELETAIYRFESCL